MGDIGRVLNTSKEAILSNLTAMNVTGSNIANVNTPGYSRLRPAFGSIGVIGSSTDDAQLGVKIIEVERLYDKYLESQIVQQEQGVGYYDTQMDLLNNAEGIFNESTGGGINDLLSKFWGDWLTLSANPGNTTARDTLVSDAQGLASMFNQKANDLINLQTQANTSISEEVAQVNTYLDDMVDLNDKITQIEISGGNATGLRDDRTELLKKIGSIIDVNYYEESNGSLNIFISNGKSLVVGTNKWELDVETNTGNSNYYDVVFQDTPGEAINSSLISGKLAALIDVRDTKVAGYLSDLNDMASTIITEVNDQHQLGYDVNKNIGGSFFSPASTTSAKDMEVDSAIVADSGRIAASATVNGDGDNATLINGIKDSSVMSIGTATIDNFYQSLVARTGRDVANTKLSLDHQTSVMNQLTSQREAVSGVSIDEEMLNLIKYQSGYNAAARLCGIVTEMMDTLINLGE